MYGGAYAHDVVSRQRRFVTQRAEDRLFVVEKIERGVEFSNLSIAHDQYSIIVDDGVKPVGDAEQRGRSKSCLDGTLKLGVCLCVDVTCRFILGRYVLVGRY